MLTLWPLLLPFAAWTGWFVAKRPELSSRRGQSKVPNGYVKGLNYILNEQPDKAIDVFIHMLEVDDDTVETHLALGGLFRRRGEVDRAIRIHQNLIARPQLAHSQRIDALMALGKDYMCAGVYDRAERIFNEVTDLGGNSQAGSLNNLLSIYMQQKAWLKALSTLEKLQQVTGSPMSLQVAHCHCQLVEVDLQANQYKQAALGLRQAHYADKNLVRVSLLHGQLEFKQGNFRQAIKAYKKVSEQDPDFISEIVQPLSECYNKLGLSQQFQHYMKELLKRYPRSSIMFSIARQLKLEQGTEAAIDFVTELLSETPSLKGLHQLIEWHLDIAYGKVKTKLAMLHGITKKLIADKPTYRCESCGFSGKILHWNCPSCKKWSTTKPICGIEGE